MKNPLPMQEFLAAFTSNKPLMLRPDQKLLGPLLGLPFLSSLEDLLNAWPLPIQAHLPDVRDEVSSIDTNAKDARKLFQNGMGLLFNEAQNLSPELIQTLSLIRRELGLSALTYGRCLIYATPHGKGTAPHFDQNINFVLQIRGTKKWRVAPNNSVINPLTRFTMGMEVEPEMQTYQSAPMPLEMPEVAETFELTPGSVLFVPRGSWHETLAQGDALALNFTFTAPTWIDLFTAALRGRLALSAEWRETACQDPSQLDDLLAELTSDLPHWRAQDILEATESSDFQ
jgi:50S ribosomal protein L16 3-hydroxylase